MGMMGPSNCMGNTIDRHSPVAVSEGRDFATASRAASIVPPLPARRKVSITRSFINAPISPNRAAAMNNMMLVAKVAPF